MQVLTKAGKNVKLQLLDMELPSKGIQILTIVCELNPTDGIFS